MACSRAFYDFFSKKKTGCTTIKKNDIVMNRHMVFQVNFGMGRVKTSSAQRLPWRRNG